MAHMTPEVEATYSTHSSLKVVITCEFNHFYYKVDDDLLARAIKIFSEDYKVAKTSGISMGAKENLIGQSNTNITVITIVADDDARLADIGYGTSQFEDEIIDWLKQSN